MENSTKITLQILNAFVDNDKGGNPAGVVLNADALTNDQKLKIASMAGLSETAFVSKSDKADFKLDFFTPTRQIAHCGHATVATFSYLSQLGAVKEGKTSKETIDGTREIFINRSQAFMEQKAPVYSNVANEKQIILKSLGLSDDDVVKDLPLLIANTGNSFLLVAVSGNESLKKIRPDFNLIAAISEKYNLVGYYVFHTEALHADATTRMFAPRYGIKEESATGMAAGPLACYLYDYCSIKKDKIIIHQGWFMENPSPSLLICELEIKDEKIEKLFVGGKGILSQTKTFII